MGLKSSKHCTPKAAMPSAVRDTELQHLFLRPDAAIAPDAPCPSSVPTVLCFHGSGHGTHQDTWLAVIQGVATFAPILYYDRRGISHNTDITNNNTAPKVNQTPDDAVKDLQHLLRALNIRPPYILLAHSYGGTIARTFLQRWGNQVGGMVLAETGQETPTPYDELQYRRRILGTKPVSVIHAVLGDSDSGKVEDGGGCSRDIVFPANANRTTDGNEERRRMRQMWLVEDERLKKAQLRLSSNARYVRVDGCGHNVVGQRPDVVIEQVKWVLEDILKEGEVNDERSGSRRRTGNAGRWLSRK